MKEQKHYWQNSLYRTFHTRLTSKGLDEHQATVVLQQTAAKDKSMAGRLSRPVGSFHPMTVYSLWNAVRAETLKWIDANAEGHFARPSFTSPTPKNVPFKPATPEVDASAPAPARQLKNLQLFINGSVRKRIPQNSGGLPLLSAGPETTPTAATPKREKIRLVSNNPNLSTPSA